MLAAYTDTYIGRGRPPGSPHTCVQKRERTQLDGNNILHVKIFFPLRQAIARSLFSSTGQNSPSYFCCLVSNDFLLPFFLQAKISAAAHHFCMHSKFYNCICILMENHWIDLFVFSVTYQISSIFTFWLIQRKKA